MATNGIHAGDRLQLWLHTKFLKSYTCAVGLEMGDLVHVLFGFLLPLFSMALVCISLH